MSLLRVRGFFVLRRWLRWFWIICFMIGWCLGGRTKFYKGDNRRWAYLLIILSNFFCERSCGFGIDFLWIVWYDIADTNYFRRMKYFRDLFAQYNLKDFLYAIILSMIVLFVLDFFNLPSQIYERLGLFAVVVIAMFAVLIVLLFKICRFLSTCYFRKCYIFLDRNC